MIRTVVFTTPKLRCIIAERKPKKEKKVSHWNPLVTVIIVLTANLGRVLNQLKQKINFRKVKPESKFQVKSKPILSLCFLI